MADAPKLDRESIVREALALLAEGGLAAVSLRRVAARLDARAPSLYWHVADKQALYRLMSQTVFRACLAAVPPAADWQGWLRGFALALWEGQRATPDAHRLILTTRTTGGGIATDEVIGPLVALGLPAAVAAPAQASVQALVTGWTTLRGADAADVDPAFLDGLEALIAGWEARKSGSTDAVPAAMISG
ncbi:MAG: TetR family transcriptional regulator [Sphingomonas fennica]